MLNEQLDGLGQERGMDVGVSELVAAQAPHAAPANDAPANAADAAPTSAADYVAAASALPPSNDPQQ